MLQSYIRIVIRTVLYTGRTLYGPYFIRTVLCTDRTLYGPYFIRTVLYTDRTLYGPYDIRTLCYTDRILPSQVFDGKLGLNHVCVCHSFVYLLQTNYRDPLKIRVRNTPRMITISTFVLPSFACVHVVGLGTRQWQISVGNSPRMTN